MRRFDLGMSLDYCSGWGVTEAVREIFQNAYDAEVINSKNKMYFNYDKDEQVLRIGNIDGFLETTTLLLGVSSKRENIKTIGQHGEGYKVATVVLMRCGKSIKIYNRHSKEVWTAKVIKSRRYKADVVVYDIEKVSIFKSVPNHDLIFEVSGITPEEYSEIVDSNLHLQEDLGVVHQGKCGRILTDEKYAGKLFVGGLFVSKSRYADYGYDFNPDVIQLDRDRGFVDTINLQFLCGKVICEAGDVELIKDAKERWDGEYIRLYTSSYSNRDELAKFYEDEYRAFLKKYGDDAIPTTDTVTFNRLKRNGYNAVMVSSGTYHYVTSASSYVETVDEEGVSDSDLADSVLVWFNKYIEEGTDAYNVGKELIEEVCNRLKND